MTTSSNDERKQMLEIAELLLSQTNAGKVYWSESRGTNDEFISSGPNSGVKVSSWLDEQEDTNYRLDIVNPRGSLVASVATIWTADPDDWGDNPGARPTSESKILETLFLTARRSALGADKVLSAIKDDLTNGLFSDELPF